MKRTLAKKKQTKQTAGGIADAYIAGAGTVVEQPITETIETNFMPYAMSVILSRAIPEIDGFKPSHRKLLYTMYNMGLLNGPRTKSANIVGTTMRLNPHGDMAIYDTMVRLSQGYEALLHPFVDSKGNFGKAYSRDMACAASRYTEAKLSSLCAELFRDIDRDTVDFTDNYDATMKEPTLLPVTFPSVLVNANTGIAVGMASSICPFNLEEVCRTAIAYIKDNDCNLSDTLLAPDFPGGGMLLHSAEELSRIYETGRGGFKIRSVYTYDKSENCIDITQIPPTATAEAIIDKIIELVKLKKVTEINDIRDETGLHGLKITIDLKRGVDPHKLMRRLFRMTPLEDTFSCNFNILIAGSPRVMGIREILDEWTAFRAECVRRRIYYNKNKAEEKLHLLRGLQKILLDIDKAIAIIRRTEDEKEVVPNLMIGFGIDEIQADYVAEIRLRHLNREFILKRTKDIDDLEKEIAALETILKSRSKLLGVIVKELEEIISKYSQPRKTLLIYADDTEDEEDVEAVPDYPVHLFFTKEGYFKKITPQSLRMSGEQKLKEGDELIFAAESSNARELLFFTDRCQVYKSRVSEFDETKASLLGDYVAAKLEMDEGESPVFMVVTEKYEGHVIFFFENGKAARVTLRAYHTLTNRRKLVSAYSSASPLSAILHTEVDEDIALRSSNGRILLINSAQISEKTTKNVQGVNVMTQRKGHRLTDAFRYAEGSLTKPHRHRARNLPAAGAIPEDEDSITGQLTF